MQAERSDVPGRCTPPNKEYRGHQKGKKKGSPARAPGKKPPCQHLDLSPAKLISDSGFQHSARLALKKYITKVSATVAESEKGPGRLLKEDKNNILIACRMKNEWLETHLAASVNELHEQKQQLENVVTPIFTKMATPRQVRSAKSVV